VSYTPVTLTGTLERMTNARDGLLLVVVDKDRMRHIVIVGGGIPSVRVGDKVKVKGHRSESSGQIISQINDGVVKVKRAKRAKTNPRRVVDDTRLVKLIGAANKQARSYNTMMSNALRTYGSHGVTTSGVGRDHFPTAVKKRLRDARSNAGSARSRFEKKTRRKLHATAGTRRAAPAKVSARKSTALRAKQAGVSKREYLRKNAVDLTVRYLTYDVEAIWKKGGHVMSQVFHYKTKPSSKTLLALRKRLMRTHKITDLYLVSMWGH